MSQYPFPTNLFRVFGESQITVLERDADGHPTTVGVRVDSPGDRAVALVLLQNSPRSFVLDDGWRYFPDGTVRRTDPTRPGSVEELSLHFDMELIEPGDPPQMYLFTYSEQQWSDAKEAFRHLVQQGRLSPFSYLEGRYADQVRGLWAARLDAQPHEKGLVELIREAAYGRQNDLDEKHEFLDEITEMQKERRRWKRDDTWHDEERGGLDIYEFEYRCHDGVCGQGDVRHAQDGERTDAWWKEEEEDEIAWGTSVSSPTPHTIHPLLTWIHRVRGSLTRLLPLMEKGDSREA